jgi:hypothetical protein
MSICRAEAMPSVNCPLLAGQSGLVDCIQVEKSLLFNHLSDLEAYRGTHADRAHSTDGFLNLLLDFVKNTYAFSAESNSTPSATSSNSHSLTPPVSTDFLTVSQPASKIADLDLQKIWDEEGWEHIVFDFEDATPVLSSYLHPLDSTHSDAAFSDLSWDNSSSGTLSESGSEISSQAESNVEQVSETQESSGLEANCQVYRHPATPPASPEPSIPAVQNGNQGNEMRLSCGLARPLENALKDSRPADG